MPYVKESSHVYLIYDNLMSIKDKLFNAINVPLTSSIQLRPQYASMNAKFIQRSSDKHFSVKNMLRPSRPFLALKKFWFEKRERKKDPRGSTLFSLSSLLYFSCFISLCIPMGPLRYRKAWHKIGTTMPK